MVILEIACFIATAFYLGQILRRHPEILRGEEGVGLDSASNEITPQLGLQTPGVRS